MQRRIVFFCWLCLSASGASGVDLVDLAKRTKPAVCLIEARDGAGREMGTGTGFLVDPAGVVATNHHVIASASKLTLKFYDNSEELIADYLAVDTESDLALLRASKAPQAALALGRFDSVKQGQSVIVYGNPLGLEGVLSQGIISALRIGARFPADLAGDSERMPEMQITAPISGGSSGSPVLNEDGLVVGIAVSKIRGGDNLNFAISVDHLKALLERAPEKPIPLGSDPRRWINLGISVALLAAIALGVRWYLRHADD